MRYVLTSFCSVLASAVVTAGLIHYNNIRQWRLTADNQQKRLNDLQHQIWTIQDMRWTFEEERQMMQQIMLERAKDQPPSKAVPTSNP